MMTSATELLDSYLRQSTQPQTRRCTDVASGRKDRACTSGLHRSCPKHAEVCLSDMRVQDSAHQSAQGRHGGPVEHRSHLSRSSISKPLQDLVNRCNKLNSSLALSQQAEPVLSSNDFMSDLASLRTRYLANAPSRSQQVLQRRKTLRGLSSSSSEALEAHWQRLALPSAVHGSSDILLDSVSERSASGHMQPQYSSIPAWQSQENVNATQFHSALSRRTRRRSQPLYPQAVKEEHMVDFLNPALYCPEDPGKLAHRRSCSNHAVEQDRSMASYSGSLPGQTSLLTDLRGRRRSPVRAPVGIKRADSHSAVSTDDEGIKHFSAAAYLSIDQATPQPFRASHTDLEPHSIEPIRTPLTDCLRDFFARQSASREMESQEQTAAQRAPPKIEQESSEHAASTSCLAAAAAEARIRTAEALQAVQNVHLSSSSFPVHAAFGEDSEEQGHTSPSPSTAVVQLSQRLQHCTELSATPEPHQMCTAAQRVREIYPDIFQPGQSPSFHSSPGGMQLTSYAPERITSRVHSSPDGRLRASCSTPLMQPHTFLGQVAHPSGSVSDPEQLEPESVKVDTPEMQSCAAASSVMKGWQGQGGGSAEDHVVISGLSQRAQKLLSLGRALQERRKVSNTLEYSAVNASVDHWATNLPRDSSPITVYNSS